ncbi:uncharacterized protein LOC123709089 isoform X3 [Pieris brassicae]|uniref:uncharacterized protein LOC123709089 isoform X3 n=1 Tax=Pieris brassicae TaxID=7116 RepID=UPI001E661263|nr:uncharacterized protein LOC123709089 isoform X3 [Pieris brassicae]
METIIKKHKSHRYCSVPHCKSTCSREISLFLFPKSKDLAKQWTDILDIRKQATKYIYVCSLHFDKKDFTLSMSAKKRRLKNGAIPSKNLPIIKAASSGPRATQLRDIEDIKLKEPKNGERAPFKKMLKDGANKSDSLAECRACLQLCANEEQHNLFKCWDPPWAGMENTPAEDLSKLACVQISQTDTHSKILCQSCYKHLQNACQFVEIVKKADEVLSLRIGVNPHTPDSWPKPIQIDKNVPYDKVQIKDEIFSDEETHQINEEDFSNVDVKIEADDWPSQSVHINDIISLGQLNKEMAEINGYLPEVEQNSKTKGLTSEGPVTNGVVNYKHDKSDSFNTNCLIVRVKEEPVSDAESETNASDLSLDCILCSKTFLSLTGLKAHVIAQHSYKTVRRKTIDDTEDNLLNYVCKICQRRFETSTDLMVHETCHNMCVCYGCNTSFETFDQLSQHRRCCKSLKNSEVGKVLKLEDVQRSITNPGLELKCPQCSETFTDAYYLDIHLDICHPSYEPKHSIHSEEEMETEVLESILGQ